MLIVLVDDHVLMFGYILIVLLLVVGPLAVFAGADSRIDDPSQRRQIPG